MEDRKKTYEIEVVDFFDGRAEAKEVFAGVIAYELKKNGKLIPFPQETVHQERKNPVESNSEKRYNEGEVQNLPERPDCALSQKDERGEGYGN